MQPEDKLLPLLRGVIAESPGKWRACCPIHGGGNEHNPSLGIEKAADGKLLLHCFVCGPDVRAARFCYAVGLTQKDLYPEDRPFENKRRPRGKIVEKYDYIDRDGGLRYQACRLDPKDFRQRRPNGKGGWIWNLRGVERILYRLPQLAASDKSQPVFIVEGERKADRLAALGFAATCNVGGAGKWKRDYSECLRDRDVIILPDNDAPGAEHAAKVTLALTGVAKSVRTVNLPGLAVKADIVNWLSAGGTPAKLNELISAAPSLENKPSVPPAEVAVDDPAAIHFESEILRDLRLDVLGELDGTGGRVKVFAEDHRKSDIIADVSKLSYERLVQICGPIIKAKVCRGEDATGGMHTLAEVKRAISLLSGYRRIGDDTEIGVGCWHGVDDDGELTDAMILVGAGEAAKWNGNKKLELITKPRAGGRLMDIGTSEPWYDFGELSRLLDDCNSTAAEETLRDAIRLFEKWSWRHSEGPTVIAGLILATWVQTIWAWRPQVAIIGKSNTGKSTLFEALAGIFGNLAIKSSKSSAAGIRQAVHRSARIILCDEFESGKHRDDILEMLRASSRGDRVFRGTASHRRTEFTLRHIAWIAAIESGLKREPDRNRFITLELTPPADSMAGRLICPPAVELANLGQRLLAVAVRYGLPARGMAVELKSRRYDGIHARLIESYAVPAAIVAQLLGYSGDDAAGILEKMLRTVDKSEGIADDESLLNDILGSNVDLGHGERATVGQAIAGRRTVAASEPALNQVGLCVFECEDVETPDGIINGDYLFVSHTMATRKLLRDTPWAQQSIDQILCRISGAVKSRRRFGGQNLRGVMIPMSVITGSRENSSKRNAGGTDAEHGQLSLTL